MKTALLSAIAAAVFAASPASAYSMRNTANGGPCVADGSACEVLCDNGTLAGTMYWNGNVWTDGTKSDPDKDAEARKICAANGTACT
jgi:hypothetical protein